MMTSNAYFILTTLLLHNIKDFLTFQVKFDFRFDFLTQYYTGNDSRLLYFAENICPVENFR
jgi:hypothetical protein